MPRFFYPLLYCFRRRDRRFGLHILRDGTASSILVDVLHSMGYQRGGTLINRPPVDPREQATLDLGEEQRFSSDDVLVVTTRPPMNRLYGPDGKLIPDDEPYFDYDDPAFGPHAIEPSRTTLERRILRVLLHYFKHLGRSHLELDDAYASELHPQFANRACLDFRVHKGQPGGVYRRRDVILRWGQSRGEMTDCPRVDLATCFLIWHEAIWPGGPGLLCAFGMSGEMTLIWSHIVSRLFRHLLEPGLFLMAEASIRGAGKGIDKEGIGVNGIPLRPFDLCFSEEWHWQILLPSQQMLHRRLSERYA